MKLKLISGLKLNEIFWRLEVAEMFLKNSNDGRTIHHFWIFQNMILLIEVHPLLELKLIEKDIHMMTIYTDRVYPSSVEEDNVTDYSEIPSTRASGFPENQVNLCKRLR